MLLQIPQLDQEKNTDHTNLFQDLTTAKPLPTISVYVYNGP